MLRNMACSPNFLFHGYLLQGFLHLLRKQLAFIPCSVTRIGIVTFLTNEVCEERLQKSVLEYLDTLIVL